MTCIQAPTMHAMQTRRDLPSSGSLLRTLIIVALVTMAMAYGALRIAYAVPRTTLGCYVAASIDVTPILRSVVGSGGEARQPCGCRPERAPASIGNHVPRAA